MGKEGYTAPVIHGHNLCSYFPVTNCELLIALEELILIGKLHLLKTYSDERFKMI
jgi:hypothetical protein